MSETELDPLSRLAILHGTDKFGYHDYTPNYHAILSYLRDHPIKLLEIGVGGYGDEDRGGQSLATWRDYFPNAQIIVGIDIQKKSLDLGPRVRILQGSQVDEEFLLQVDREFGPFDVIIDDGSHRNEHVVETFNILYPRLVPGGVYIAEDVQTSFHPRFGGSLDLTAPNSVGFFSEMMTNWSSRVSGPIVQIERFHNIFAIHKPANGRSNEGSEILNSVAVSNVLADASRRFSSTLSSLPPVKAHKDVVGTGNLDLRVEEMAQAKTETSLAGLLESLKPDGEALVLVDDGTPRTETVLPALLSQIDHLEILVHFPHAEIMSAAPMTYSAHAFSDGVLLVRGDNTYPSNFRWSPDHPRTRAAISEMGKVLQSPDASETGLLQFADIQIRHFDPAGAMSVLDRLERLGSKERQYYQLMGQQLRKSGQNARAHILYKEALDTFPNDPQFAINVASGLLNLGDEKEAEDLIRGILSQNPRARALIVMLSKILEKRGDFDEALDLSERSINLFPIPMRPTRLADLARLAHRAGRVGQAKAALDKAIELAPKDDAVLAMKADLDL